MARTLETMSAEIKPKNDSKHTVAKELAAMKRAAKKVTASPESAKAFLRRAGILDAKGRLKKPYA